MTCVNSVELGCISDDCRLQMRENLSGETVAEYSQLLTDAADQAREQGTSPEWPFIGAVKLSSVRDEFGRFTVIDGFHRIAAAKQAGWTWVAAEIVDGSFTDALISACGANSDHGLPRSNAGKRNAVRAALSDPVMCGYSDRVIAGICKVSNRFVGIVRHELATVNGSQLEVARVGADGRERQLPNRVDQPQVVPPEPLPSSCLGQRQSSGVPGRELAVAGQVSAVQVVPPTIQPRPVQAPAPVHKPSPPTDPPTMPGDRALNLISTIEQSIASVGTESLLPVGDGGAIAQNDDAETVRTFSGAEAARFKQAFAVMIRTVDRGKELEQINHRDHARIIGKLKDLAKDWASLLPGQEWL